jgi:hypothetical protein
MIATTKTITARTTKKSGRMLGLVNDKEKKISQIEKKTLNHPCIKAPPSSFTYIIYKNRQLASYSETSPD